MGDELVIAHPRSDLHVAGSLMTLGGPALYLAGVIACAARIGRPPGRLRVAVTVLLLALIPVAAETNGLVAAIVATALLASVVVAEQLQLSVRA